MIRPTYAPGDRVESPLIRGNSGTVERLCDKDYGFSVYHVLTDANLRLLFAGHDLSPLALAVRGEK